VSLPLSVPVANPDGTPIGGGSPVPLLSSLAVAVVNPDGSYVSPVGGGTPLVESGLGDAGTSPYASHADHVHPGASLVRSIDLVIDGGESAITTGIKMDVIVDRACTISAWTLLADQTGSIVIDIWRDTYANFPPTDADSLPGAGKEPTIVAGIKGQDTDLSDWAGTVLAAGDILRINVASCVSIIRATLSLRVAP
jgi:hypothetical protein